MNGLVVGLGSIGRRHLKNLRQILPQAELTVLRSSDRSSHEAPPEEASRVVYSFDDALLHEPRFAVIASPAPFHVETALRLAERGVHLCIEKPISDRLDRVQDLIRLCRQRGLVLMVAYNLRFAAPLRTLREALMSGRIGKLLGLRIEAGQYLPDWRPNADYRQSVSARRDLGGGALLELSHEIDYARWLAGDIVRVSADVRKLSNLEIDVEDCAELTVNFASGVLGSIHIDMLQHTPTRTCKLIGSEGTLTWDAIVNQVRLFSAETRVWEDLHSAQSIDRNAMYVDELAHFLDCLQTGATPLITGEDGRQALQVVLAAKRSAELEHPCEVES